MTEQSPRVLVARCDNYREDVDAPCTGEIRFRWGMSQSDPCNVCCGRCGIAVADWERVDWAGAVPDTGQAGPHHLVTSHWDAAGGEVLYRSCTCGEEWARDEDRCPEDDIETLDVADLLDRLDLIQARNPDEQRHLDDTLDALRRELAEPSGDTGQASAQPDLAYARSEVDKWLADNDPYCILPTRTEHIPALLARLDELEGTR